MNPVGVSVLSIRVCKDTHTVVQPISSNRISPHAYTSKQSSPEAQSVPPLTGSAPRVAVIREEGSNGDREMAAAFSMAGFEPWDVNMQDLMDGRVTLDSFRGVAFVGGFSYADVCGSAKGELPE